MEEGQIERPRAVMPAARPELWRPLRPMGVEAVRGAPDEERQAIERGDQTADAEAKAVAAGPTDRMENAHDDLCERDELGARGAGHPHK